MAKWLLSVLVLSFVQIIFTHGEDRCNKISSCNECFRCGGKAWCSDQKPMLLNDRCALGIFDDNWCTNLIETADIPDDNTSEYNPHDMISPRYKSTILFVKDTIKQDFTYISDMEQNITIKVETSQNKNGFIAKVKNHDCSGGKCKFTIEASADTSFCSNSSSSLELTNVQIKVDNLTDDATIKYYVPCACECSKEGVQWAPKCSGNGNFSCGACTCHDGWSGWNCNEKIETSSKRNELECGERGDINNQCTLNGVVCSGNGHCGPCGNCICDTNKEGSQYFERNFCTDICTQISEHESFYVVHCLANATLGLCHSTQEESWITKFGYNKTIADQRDNMNRRIWIPCTETFITEEKQKCYVEYLVKRQNVDEKNSDVMVVKSCNDYNSDTIAAGAGIGGDGSTKVPLILGILAGIVAVAALAGVVAWKYFHATPAMPFASPDYQNIDAEDCVGQNPLYKPPTSTFINPQFGKC